jgi:hypothetical protein
MSNDYEIKTTVANGQQPSNADGFRRVSLTKPINDRGKQRQEQVNPALRLSLGRYKQC